MTIVRDTINLVCDTCGTRLDVSGTDAIVIRIEASVKGWRYVPGLWLKAKQPGWTKQSDRSEKQRFVDLCPQCDPPEKETRLTDWAHNPRSAP